MTAKLRHLLAACLLVLASSEALAQYPSRAIKVIVPIPPGGAPDIAARVIGQKLSEILARLPAVEINRTRIIDLYAEIDAFSQKKHPTRTSTTSPRNMGKNDLWIAATTAVLGAKLVTVDRDFDHLDGVFFDVIYIHQKLTPADT